MGNSKRFSESFFSLGVFYVANSPKGGLLPFSRTIGHLSMPKLRSRGKATRKLQTVAMGTVMTTRNKAKKRRGVIPLSHDQIEEYTQNWISGYKITHADGKSHMFGKDGRVQYEEGKIVKVSGKIEVANNGLHFALDPLHAAFFWPGSHVNIALWEIKAKPTRAIERTAGHGDAVNFATSQMLMETKCSDEEMKRRLSGWLCASRDKSYETYDLYIAGRCAARAYHESRITEDGKSTVTFTGSIDGNKTCEETMESDKEWKSCWEAFLTRMRVLVEGYEKRRADELKQPCAPLRYEEADDEWSVTSNEHDYVIITYTTPVNASHRNLTITRPFGACACITAEHCPTLEEAVLRAELLIEDNEDGGKDADKMKD
jgi:hypothetical protein